MADDEQVKKQSRVVVQTPTARREVTRTEGTSTPGSSGTSSAAIAAMVILAVAVIGLLALLFWSMNTKSDNANLAAQQQPTPQTIIQQPAQQPPVIVQQPAAQPPIIVNPPAGTAPASGSETRSVTDDSGIQAAIDKKLKTDALFSTLNVTAMVASGKVTLLGTVKSELLKNQVEHAVKAIKGVKSVENQITVSST